MPVLQARSGLQVWPLRVKPPIQEVHTAGSVSEHSLHGSLQFAIHVLLTNLKDVLHSKQTPAEHVLQFSGHGLHEVMILLVKTGSNPLLHL